MRCLQTSRDVYKHKVSGLKAVRKSLKGQPIFNAGPGRSSCPLLAPVTDGLPFSLSLDLFQPDTSALSSSMMVRPEKGLFSLHYILEGAGQLIKKDGKLEEVHPGDSVLATHGHTYLQPSNKIANESSGGSNDATAEWRMASISLLLPKSLDDTDQGLAVARASGDWEGGPIERKLTEEEADWIIAGAKATAQDSASRQDSAAVSLLPQDESSERQSNSEGRDESTAGLSEVWSRGAKAQKGGAGHLLDSVSERTQELEPLLGPVTLDSALSNAVTTFGGFAQALQQLSRWRKRGAVGGDVLKKNLGQLNSFRLPHQTNRLALVFDPLGDSVNFTFGVEIFEPGHKTKPHVHHLAHELFFLLAGEGEAFCDDERFSVAAGDIVVFPPGSMHGIDVHETGKMYCLEVMQPNDMFAELVRAGMPAGGLLDDDLCILIASGCA